MDQLSPVRGPFSLNEQAYEAIKEAILTFKLKPGTNLVEADLARQLGMSKTPVRDALLQLEKEGLVTKVLFKGTYVSEISRQSVIEMFEIRAVLEGLAARLAAPTFNEQDVRIAEELIQQHDEALREGKLKQASEYNRRFHDLILSKDDNKLLRPILRNLDDQLRRFRLLSIYQTRRANKSVNEHQSVLDALQQKDRDAAENAMKSHLRSVLEDLSNQEIEEVLAEVEVMGQNGE